MTRRFPRIKKLLVGAVAVGTVSLATAGVAAADPTSSTTHPRVHHANCARASKVLARIRATESRIATDLPKLHAAASKAEQKGNSTRAARINKRISRLESGAYKARLEKRKSKIEAACHVSAPAPSSTGAPSTTA